MAADATLPFAVVILAGRAGAGDAVRVAEMVLIAREVGAHAIVVAVPRGWRAPPHARVVHVAPGSAPIAAVRAGMAQLSNTPARYAIIWPLDAWAVSVDRLRALVDDVQRERPMLAAIDGDDVDHAPVMIARDAWLDLMTLGEQGIEAVAARRGMRRVVPDHAT
jgi:molybdopterin-guanine dinucleotide biosynthesis protein A